MTCAGWHGSFLRLCLFHCSDRQGANWVRKVSQHASSMAAESVAAQGLPPIPQGVYVEYGSAELTSADLHMFRNNEWLSDECVAFGMELAFRRTLKRDAAWKVFHPGCV